MLVSLSCQRGMALLVSLVFMPLLSLIGVAAMVSAMQQEKMAAGIQHANHSFQAAEAALASGEAWLEIQWLGVLPCTLPVSCNPPLEARTRAAPGVDPGSGVSWVSVEDGLYGVQNLGPSITPAHLPVTTTTRLYRVTAIGWRGLSRTVLESIYARYQAVDKASKGAVAPSFDRVMWRQLQ